MNKGKTEVFHMGNFKEKFIGNRKEVGIIPSIIMVAVSIFLSVIIVHALNKGDKGLFEVLSAYGAPLLWLNILPIIIFAAFLTFSLGRPVFSSIVTIVFFAAMGFANRLKVNMRQDPFIPTDFTLVSECKTILQSFNRLKLAIGFIALGIVVLLLIWLFMKFKSEYFTKKLRIGGTIITVAAALLLNMGLFSKVDLYNAFPVDGNSYFKVHQYASRGLVYSFTHDLNFVRVIKPDHYDKSFYEEKESDFVPSEYGGEAKKPHIIMVMGEAISDLSDSNEHIYFEDYPDPMENYKKLAESENAVSGHIIVSGFGGGTSDTEFDVLTGLITRYIKNPKSSYSFINKEIDGLPAFLNRIGYRSIATHPGYSWFYNRNNVYDFMGFSEKFFLEDSFDLDKDGINLYISDEACFNFLIEKFDEHIANYDNPLFSFCVTIENHGPYKDKYTEEPTFNTDLSLENLREKEAKDDINHLSNYFIGVRDFDEGLKNLTDHLEASGEPVIVVVFGDHLPGFSNGLDVFEDLQYNISPSGTVEQVLNLYSPPFLIWGTSAAGELIDIKAEAAALGINEDNSTINSNYLSAALMEILGYKNLSPYFNFLSDAMKTLPVSTNNNFITGDGTYTRELGEKEKEIVTRLRGWTYYEMFDRKHHE